MKFKLYFLTFYSFLWVGWAQAASQAPLPMLEETANKIITALQIHQDQLSEDPNYAYKVVERYLLPHVDVTGMARSVVGGQVWSEASETEKQRFSDQFIRLVIRTYSAALTGYSNETVQFQPLRGDTEGSRFITINSVIVRTKANDIPLSYSLVKSGDSWKIYDISVEGVSLLQSYRSQFNAVLSQGSFASLIDKLAANNQGTKA